MSKTSGSTSARTSAKTPAKTSSKTPSLVENLFAEVLQTERSANRHCGLEAERLEPSPPADALVHVSQHARAAERELKELARARGFHVQTVGLVVGRLFSMSRNGVADFFLTTEQSYRGTLLGVRHGYDVVTLLHGSAEREGDAELATWCASWRAARLPRMESLAAALQWFVEHPERALRRARGAIGG